MGVLWAVTLQVLLAVSVTAGMLAPTLLVAPLNQKEQVVIWGYRIVSGSRQRISAFEGIPYALPPEGALRFKPPQPVKEYPNLVNATMKQLPCPFLNKRGQVVGSEKCLYINVYAPEDVVKTSNGDSEKLPVLVMLPGIGWAGRWKPHRIVERRLVLVTVQSRTGALGFLTSGAEDAPGNLGLLDEVLALEWVRNNIRGFGGDPNRITLAGVGVGAEAVQLHMVSPLSAGAFNRSITISGSALSPWAFTTDIKEAVMMAKRLANHIGCNCSQANATTSTCVECLRNSPLEDIVKGTKHLQGWLGLPPSPFVPVVDGHFLPDSPRALWEAGRAANVPLLIGLAKGDGLGLLTTKTGLLDSPSLLEELHQGWERLAPQLLALNSSRAEDRVEAAVQLRERYLGLPANSSDDSDFNITSVSAREALLRLVADRHVVLPALRALALHSRSAAANRAAFLYLYSWTGTSTPAPQKTSVLDGPEGGRDTEILFMEPSSRENVTNPLLRAMANDILDLWASFVTTGKPIVGNTTLNASTGGNRQPDSSGLNLLGPGQQETSVLVTKETIAFWDSLPLSENNITQRNPSPDAQKEGAVQTSGSEALFSTSAGVLKLVILYCALLL